MARSRSVNGYATLAAVVILLAAWLVVRQCNPDTNPGGITENREKTGRGLNRNPVSVRFSKHARCRMDCRKIDESEVRSVISNGTINYRKSQLQDASECARRYALEGITRDRQRVRIIVVPCRSEMTIVTVIDLDTDWVCDCGS